MPVIARDAVASDHLVYAWPFPIGPEDLEVSCADDELVVMCPAWLVGDRLGPGRHRWRTPDPSRPVHAYFVLTAPVEVSFDMVTLFHIPTTGMPVRLRAAGSLQVRCMDPALLVAQFVGLPFDHVNEGVLRSVSRSIERMLARLLTRRVVMAGTPAAVTDPSMLSNIIEELVAYNPTAGAVFGVELVRFGHMQIYADDGSVPWEQMLVATNNGVSPSRISNGAPHAIDRDSQATAQMHSQLPPPEVPRIPPTVPGRAKAVTAPPPIPAAAKKGNPVSVASGEIVPKAAKSGPAKTLETPVVPPPPSVPPAPAAFATGSRPPTPSPAPMAVPTTPLPGGSHPGLDAHTPPPHPGLDVHTPPPQHPGLDVHTPPPQHPGLDVHTPTPRVMSAAQGPSVSGEIGGPKPRPTPVPPPTPAAAPVAAPSGAVQSSAQSTASGEIGGSKQFAQGTPTPRAASEPQEARGSIMGIGVSPIGASGVASGEITKKIAPGGRVLVPGPNGLMQSATVRQLLQGYYELEVGGSGETIWVPVNGVVPE